MTAGCHLLILRVINILACISGFTGSLFIHCDSVDLIMHSSITLLVSSDTEGKGTILLHLSVPSAFDVDESDTVVCPGSYLRITTELDTSIWVFSEF